jgi:hypothetical protein
MRMLQQIQSDVLDHNVPLSSILRKAKVFARQLKSEELEAWASQELDGYPSNSTLPDYRILKTVCVGKWSNGYWSYNNHPIPLQSIEDDDLRRLLTVYSLYGGVRSIEQYAVERNMYFFVPLEIVAAVNYYVSQDDYGYEEIHYAFGPQRFEQVLDTIRNRLLDFLLALDSNWHTEGTPPPDNILKEIVSVQIYNNPQGGNVSIFDQRNQHVGYQYNAAGDININAAQTKDELAAELDKLRIEIGRAREAKAVDSDVAVEADYHLLQASKEAKKDEPDKESFLDHVGKAKALLDDAAAAAGLATALMKAAEVAQQIFR